MVTALRGMRHSVYDFREDDDLGSAFNWSDIDPKWQEWDAERFRFEIASNTRAMRGFERDFNALRNAEALALVMPCGRSAHLELGYAIGARKITAILLENGEPELMYRAVGKLCVSLKEMVRYFDQEAYGLSLNFTSERGEISKKRPDGVVPS